MAAGSTILSCAPGCGEGASSLTLSAPATASGEGVALEAFSACTEPEAACTLPVSEEAEALSGVNASRFLAAAADGSAAYFLSGSDLYRFELSKALAGEAPDTLLAHETRGVLGASEDASVLYLVSEEALGGGGEEGEPNLYRHVRGGGFEFIATLGGPHDVEFRADNATGASSIEAAPVKHLARVTPDGGSAAFVSADPALAQAGGIRQRRRGLGGTRPRGLPLRRRGRAGWSAPPATPPARARTGPTRPTAATSPPAATNPRLGDHDAPRRALSANGRRLFFESFEALVPRDTDGSADVYEWEAAGRGAVPGGARRRTV